MSGVVGMHVCVHIACHSHAGEEQKMKGNRHKRQGNKMKTDEPCVILVGSTLKWDPTARESRDAPEPGGCCIPGYFR